MPTSRAGVASTIKHPNVAVSSLGVSPTNAVPVGAGSKFTSGSGAPAGPGNKGDFYFRTDTPAVAGQRIYTCTVASLTTATWVSTAA